MDIQRTLLSFYTKNKDNPLIITLRDVYSQEPAFPFDALSLRRMQKTAARKHNPTQKARICFLINDPNIWIKFQGIYEAVCRSGAFEVMLLCVPDLFAEEGDESCWHYFSSRGYDCVDAAEDGRWFDLKAWKPDYVLYSQPYNNYLPRQYRSYVVSGYAKIIAHTYAMTIAMEFMENDPRCFQRDVSLSYVAIPEEVEFDRQRFPRHFELGLQKSKFLGFPAFRSLLEAKGKPSPSFAFSKNDFRAIWTPRWITDERLGGSNFFRYKDQLFDYARTHPDTDLLFRPHPMALDNFVHTGEMTAEEAAEFRRLCDVMPNVSLDAEKEYSASFWQSNVLISDVSSIVVEYFITGKPIIYCSTPKSTLHYMGFFQRILDANYVVASWQELSDTLDALHRGKDPKFQQRQTLIHDLYGDMLGSAAERIVEDIIEDFRT